MILDILHKLNLKLKHFSPTYYSLSTLLSASSPLCYCSWDSANSISLFPSGSTLCSEDRPCYWKVTEGGRESLFFPGLSLCHLCLCEHYHSYHSNCPFLWQELNPGCSFPTGAELVSSCSFRGKSTSKLAPQAGIFKI